MRTVSIGDFARMTHLSVKALRHYHEVGVLKPAALDGYTVSQVPTAQAIRRGRASVRIIPAVELAIVSLRGSRADIDRAYGALGAYVAEHEIGSDSSCASTIGSTGVRRLSEPAGTLTSAGRSPLRRTRRRANDAHTCVAKLSRVSPRRALTSGDKAFASLHRIATAAALLQLT
jgi:hypothetical protein